MFSDKKIKNSWFIFLNSFKLVSLRKEDTLFFSSKSNLYFISGYILLILFLKKFEKTFKYNKYIYQIRIR